MKIFKRALISLDIIGEEIKFYNDQRTGTRHQSICGGLISIAVVCLSTAVCIYFSMGLFIRENPNAYQISKYEDITPKIEFSKSSLFFGTYLWSPKGPINETILNFYGTMRYRKEADVPRIYADYQMRRCSYENDFKGLEYLFEKDKTDINTMWWCFGDMIINGTVIPQDDPKYAYPFTEHGMSSNYGDPIFFEVGATRCQNSSANNYSCVSNEVINSFLENSYYRIVLIDNNFDQTNYEQPITKYLKIIDGSGSSSNYAANYLNFNNVFFSTNDGIVFDNIETINTYVMLDRVEVVSPIFAGSSFEGNVYMFRLEGQNSPQIYNRIYPRLQDVLANVGGVIEALFFISKILNYSLNSFTSKKNILERVVLKYVTLRGETDNVDNKSKVKTNFRKLEEPPEQKVKKDTKFFVKIQESTIPKIFSMHSNSNIAHIQDPGPPLQEPKSCVKIPTSKILPVTSIKKNHDLKQTTLNQKSVMSSLNINCMKYFLLKIKKTLLFGRGKQIDIIDNLEITEKIRKKIFNENTIYRMFFDLQKLKNVLFDEEQMKAFDCLKVDFKTSFSRMKLNKLEYISFCEILANSEDKISIKLAKLLKEGVYL